MDESKLKLLYWDGAQWVDSATTCSPTSVYQHDPVNNSVTVAICHLTEFALAAPQIPLAVSLTSVHSMTLYPLWTVIVMLVIMTCVVKYVHRRRSLNS